MKQGRLSDYFTGVATKVLTASEINPTVSNQHSFYGTTSIRRLLGTQQEPPSFNTRFVYLGEDDDSPVIEDAFTTWSDVRSTTPERGAEWRLYYPLTPVSERAATGDLLVIAQKPDGSLLVIIIEAGSTMFNQMVRLLNLDGVSKSQFLGQETLRATEQLGLVEILLLESIGIEIDVTEDTYLDQMLTRFEGTFPTTREFSKFARSVVGPVDLREDPDTAIMLWMEQEELLFRTLEKHLVTERLHSGFADDVDGFISYSLSVQNRRKSRVGYALENHLEAIFQKLGIDFKRSATTENNSKPDFLFPSQEAYHDASYDPTLLTVLAVKSTCKERWRQVLSEADRVKEKHLLTLETAISPDQTNEMISRDLQLVLPRALHQTYTPQQQQWLMDIKQFVELVQERERRMARAG